MDTTTDAALLQLIWLASPALPVGGFSYSEGLEAAVEADLVRDEGSAGDWLVDQLDVALARGDLAVVAAAVEAARANDMARLAQLDAWVLATRETSELRQQTEQMGRSLGEWQRSFTGVRPAALTTGLRTASQPHEEARPGPDATRGAEAVGWGDARNPSDAPRPATYPVAFATAAASTTASPRQVALTFAFGWAENMMQSAIKAVPLGQGAGQRILARLARAIPAAVDAALALDDEHRQAFTPMLAILSAQHETQYSRLFRS